MSLRVGAWNVEGHLASYADTARSNPDRILRGIAVLDADILVLPEAFQGEIADGVDVRLKDLGYDFYDVAYEDRDREEEYAKWGMPHLRVLARCALNDVETVRWGDVRNLLTFKAEDPEMNNRALFIATHLDDRSESQRQRQLDDMLPYIVNAGLPAVALGDFNAMWPRGRARLFGSRAVRSLAGSVPNTHMRSAIGRLSEMASGQTMTRLARQVPLRDADPRYQATVTPKQRDMNYMPSIRMAQIDHILVAESVEVSDFTIGKDEGSDHRSIAATITIK